jgi:hypothetical protein
MFWLGSSTIVFRISLFSCMTHFFGHFLGYHFALYTEMQRPLVCYLYILEAAIHTRVPPL